MIVGLRQLTVVACSLLCAATAQACKNRVYPESFPIEELKGSEHAYVVHVATVKSHTRRQDERYAPPFGFEGKIVRSLKGPMKPGEAIHGVTTSDDEPHARCPIFLEAGKTYLLMLRGDQSPYALPRYGSLYVSSDLPQFQRYIADLTKVAAER